MVVLLAGLVIFFAVTAATWAFAVALYHTFVGGPDLRQHPLFWPHTAVAVTLVTLIFFTPFWVSYPLSLAVWWVAAKYLFELPLPRAVALFLLLAALSFVSRLVLLGALEFWPARP